MALKEKLLFNPRIKELLKTLPITEPTVYRPISPRTANCSLGEEMKALVDDYLELEDIEIEITCLVKGCGWSEIKTRAHLKSEES